MNQTKRLAFCSMMAAVSVILMILGSILELGMYAAPMLAGLCILPVGRQFGRKYQAMVWLTVSALSFILVRSIEQNLMYFAVFGAYPMIRPQLERMGKWLSLAVKLALFNVVVISLEALIMLVFVPEVMGTGMTVLLLLLGNATFLLYDWAMPKYEILLNRRMEKLIGGFRK